MAPQSAKLLKPDFWKSIPNSSPFSPTCAQPIIWAIMISCLGYVISFIDLLLWHTVILQANLWITIRIFFLPHNLIMSLPCFNGSLFLLEYFPNSLVQYSKFSIIIGLLLFRPCVCPHSKLSWTGMMCSQLPPELYTFLPGKSFSPPQLTCIGRSAPRLVAPCHGQLSLTSAILD